MSKPSVPKVPPKSHEFSGEKEERIKLIGAMEGFIP
jgi:hypothetical protein